MSNKTYLQEIKNWKKQGYTKYTESYDKLEPGTFIKYVNKKGELRALQGGIIISNKKEYIVLRNISNPEMTWWLQKKYIHSVYIR